MTTKKELTPIEQLIEETKAYIKDCASNREATILNGAIRRMEAKLPAEREALEKASNVAHEAFNLGKLRNSLKKYNGKTFGEDYFTQKYGERL